MQIEVEWVGRVDYLAAWERQKALVAERIALPEMAGKFLLLEHPPTYTLGRSGRLENLLLSETELAERGMVFYQVDRGGDITYHGPGQLVGYPIISLNRVYAQSGLQLIRRYVHDLEETLIQTLRQFDIAAQRFAGHRGVWVATPNGLCKIAAVGVRIQKGGITSHGFALNVNPNMSHFSNIVPCGIQDFGVVSMAQILQRPLTITEILPHVVTAFADVFQVEASFRLPIPQIQVK